MSEFEDYYAILGVLPSAEAVVIRSVYKALVQRHHPDRNVELQEEANKKIAKINKAYSVLSDPDKRSNYDKVHRAQGQKHGSYYGEENREESCDNARIESDWDVAKKYNIGLCNTEEKLSTISTRLAHEYKLYMLETRDFRNYVIIADRMEQKFLETYFGRNKNILLFAKELIASGNKLAAKSLNKAVSVIGEASDPEYLIQKIREEYGIYEFDHLVKTDNETGSAFSVIVIITLAALLGLIISSY